MAIVEFPYPVKTTGGKDGADVSLPDAQLLSTYTSKGWNTKYWVATSGFPTLRDYVAPIPTTVFPNQDNGTDKKDGGSLSLEQLKQRTTYTNVGWGFNNPWIIEEGVGFPKLIAYGNGFTDYGALTSSKKYIHVKEDKTREKGTMYYDGKVWEYQSTLYSTVRTTGTAGQEIVYNYGGEQYKKNGIIYLFLCSGIQKQNTPGGYGDYTPDSIRLTTYQATRSNDVAFYYTQMEQQFIPYDTLVSFRKNTDVIHIVVQKNTPSALRIEMKDGSIGNIPLVEVNDTSASPIRVMTPKGVKALQHVEIVGADTTPPYITLNDEEYMELIQGSVYIDQGATATDDRDGDVSDSIEVTGFVDTNTVGTYTLTYTAHDSSGNVTTKTRTIRILAKPIVTLGKKVVLITEDVSNVSVINTKSALVENGYTVDLMASTSVTSTNLSTYDVIGLVYYPTSTSPMSWYDTVVNTKKPLFIGYPNIASSSATGVTLAEHVGVLESEYRQGTATLKEIYFDTTDVNTPGSTGYLTQNHTIMKDFKSFINFTGNLSTSNINAVADSFTYLNTGAYKGTALGHTIGPNTKSLIAVEQGTKGVNGKTMDSRVVWFGMLYGRNGYDNNGKSLINAIMRWLRNDISLPILGKRVALVTASDSSQTLIDNNKNMLTDLGYTVTTVLDNTITASTFQNTDVIVVVRYNVGTGSPSWYDYVANSGKPFMMGLSKATFGSSSDVTLAEHIGLMDVEYAQSSVTRDRINILQTDRATPGSIGYVAHNHPIVKNSGADLNKPNGNWNFKVNTSSDYCSYNQSTTSNAGTRLGENYIISGNNDMLYALERNTKTLNNKSFANRVVWFGMLYGRNGYHAEGKVFIKNIMKWLRNDDSQDPPLASVPAINSITSNGEWFVAPVTPDGNFVITFPSEFSPDNYVYKVNDQLLVRNAVTVHYYKMNSDFTSVVQDVGVYNYLMNQAISAGFTSVRYADMDIYDSDNAVPNKSNVYFGKNHV